MAAVGYLEPWSVRAGSSMACYVSCADATAGAFVVTLDRDENEQQDWPIARQTPSFGIREYHLGSWVEVPLSHIGQEFDLDVEILFTSNTDVKPVISWPGFMLTIGGDGRLRANDKDIARIANEKWYCLSLYFNAGELTCRLHSHNGEREIEGRIFGLSKPDTIHIGAEASHKQPTLNARIAWINLEAASGTVKWRFPARGPVEKLKPVDGDGPELRILNGPTFAVASPRFTGEVHDPRVNSGHFDAIHLHDDDFAGFDWAADLVISVPADARPGVYAVAIETEKGVEKLPFFVRPQVTMATVALLLPTATYLAYADEQLPPERYPWHGNDRAHLFAIDNNFLSLYDVHSDMSGVSLTSSRRPRATLRDDYHYPLSNSPHLLSVDLKLLKFLARHGIDVDILTDHDLHDGGRSAIAPYRLLLTGSHPEYWSSSMMDGLKDYLTSGGSLAYLGGNGFYWVVAFQGDKMELRRGKNEIWSGRPGELHLAMTGEPGGNWEDRGLNHPQALVGVTYVIMGFGKSRPYRRLTDSHHGAYAWLFAGVLSETFGAEGSVLGGAAGYEIDAVIRSEETPKNLVRLAVADGFDDSFQVRPDLWVADGEPERTALRRADMTIYQHEGGGLVFSTGSVAWIGALPGPSEDNDVGRIVLNLLGRFGRE
ncbi:hypothetical protein RGCCGE502_17660 [Rhizobium grahamii CCGE 502]|uniref:N,N-dimethylformamidase beta subunit-like C-terminal domain-containing protein n=2 Tax=Rhizobium grahamii TaxID=1120045 RepID=S3HFV1_9HYPH|nr:hypothetical protein RGCCGE502_17660 [Rhizobium grahamii CCGE 502]